MALALTEEHRALAEAVRGWAQRVAPPVTRREVMARDDHGAALDRGSWRPGLAAQGLLGLHLPEMLGGEGYGMTELAVAAEELGRALLPGGFLPTVLASAVLAESAAGAGSTAGPAGAAGAGSTAGPAGAAGAGSTAGPAGADLLGGLVRGLADGSLSGAVGLAGGLRAVPAGHRDATMAAGGTGPCALMIEGSCGPVLGASLADLLVLPITDGQDEIWVVVDATDLRITPLDSLDLTRPVAAVDADRVTVPPGRVLTGLTRSVVACHTAALFGAEASGIAGWAVSTAAEYAKIRHQFGRPIGQFQAVKHRCGWMLTEAEQAAAAAWDAARSLRDTAGGGGRAAEREFAAGVAAVVALDAAVTCAHECIQVLGGIGYTWEHDAHLYYRRALSLRALLGPSMPWAQRVARLALDGGRRPARLDLPDEAETVRGQVRQELSAIAGCPPAGRAERLAGAGWVVPHLPRPWGRGAGPLEQIVIAQEMTAAGLRPPALAIGAWVVPALARYGTPGQQQRFLPATLRGDMTWCQLFSEPGAGSDLAALATRADRADGGWRLTGQKIWTSLAKEAAWAICVARTDPAAPRHDGITYFLVDMSAPGVQVRPLREMTGDALFNEVFLDGVFVPDDQVVGEVNGGWRVARTTLANERVSLSQSWSFGTGVADLLDAVRGTGAADAPSPAVLAQVGALVCEGHAIDLLGLRATMKQVSGTEPGATGSVRKLLGMRHAQRVADLCWSLAGADAARGGTRWSRAVLFTRALTIGGGTTDIQLNIIGERILGLPRDPLPPAD